MATSAAQQTRLGSTATPGAKQSFSAKTEGSGGIKDLIGVGVIPFSR